MGDRPAHSAPAPTPFVALDPASAPSNLLQRAHTAIQVTSSLASDSARPSLQLVSSTQLRRKSDFCALINTANPQKAAQDPNCNWTNRPRRAASARGMNCSFTDGNVSALGGVAGEIAKRRCSRIILFGYASAGFHLEDCEWEADELGEELDHDDMGSEHISPAEDSRRSMGELDLPQGEQQHKYRQHSGTAHQQQQLQPTALFLLKRPFNRKEQWHPRLFYCHRPLGTQADQYLQSLSASHREAIRKFMEQGSKSECYLWISEDPSMESCPVVLSVKMLENFFKNEQQTRRVKWHHRSIDRMSIYRYSLPQITTKFRIRAAHFLARHYRCCILSIWLLVILGISAGIIFSVALGSAPGGGQLPNATHAQHMGPRGGGFIEDSDDSTADEKASNHGNG